MLQTFLLESKEHDEEMLENMMKQEKEMQASEHGLMREFVGSHTGLLKKE